MLYLPAATKLGQGNVFTGVCDSVHRGGLPQCMLGYRPPAQTPTRSRHPPDQTPPRADPPEQTPPWKQTPPGPDTPREQTPPGPDTPQSRPPRADTPLEADTPRTTHLLGADTHPPLGCARFAEILSELTKTWSSGATEYRV